MRGGIARVGSERRFQRDSGLVILPLARVEHGEVVVGLRQPRIVLRQFSEYAHGVVSLTLPGQDRPFPEARLRVLGFA